MIHAFDAEKFTTEAVFTLTLVKEAFVESCRVLIRVIMHAFIAERFTTEAVCIDTLAKEALLES